MMKRRREEWGEMRERDYICERHIICVIYSYIVVLLYITFERGDVI